MLDGSKRDQASYKLLFHGIFACFSLFEGLYSFSIIIYQGYTTWGFSLHMLALFCNLLSFTTVLGMWSKALSTNELVQKERVIGVCFVGINTLSTLVDLIVLGVGGFYSELYAKVEIYTTMLYVLSLFILSGGLLVYGCRLRMKLSQPLSLPLQSAEEMLLREKAIALLNRITVVLATCTVCYTVRAVFLLMLVASHITNGDGRHADAVNSIPLLLWFVVTSWIPTIIPGLFFMYIMKVPVAIPSATQNMNSIKHFSNYDDSEWAYDAEDDDITGRRSDPRFAKSTIGQPASNPINMRDDLHDDEL